LNTTGTALSALCPAHLPSVNGRRNFAAASGAKLSDAAPHYRSADAKALSEVSYDDLHQ